ncbi:MAG TPA: hypothetical protein VGF99_15680, partial [Myxococcota bacterium]
MANPPTMTTTPLPPPVLPMRNLVTMLVTSTLLLTWASSPWSMAVASWLWLLPLLVLARAATLPLAVSCIAAVVVVARLVGGALGGVDGHGVDVPVALVGAVVVVVVAVVHRFVHRELPNVGTLGAACAVVVAEYVVGSSAVVGSIGVQGTQALSFAAQQTGDVPFFRCVDLVTPLGLSAAVVWTQAVLAAYGERFLAVDPIPRHERERGLFSQT